MHRALVATLIGVVVAGAAAWVAHRRAHQGGDEPAASITPRVDPTPDARPHPRDIFARSGRTWYVGDGMLEAVPGGSTAARQRAATTLFVLNPGAADVTVTWRMYFPGAVPQGGGLRVAAGRIERLDLGRESTVPRDTPFWLAIDANGPVLPQLRRDDFTGDDPVPDALVAVAPFPGPLEDETVWVYPDGFQGGAEAWHEDETFTVLNPGPRPAQVRFRFTSRADGSQVERQVDVAPERIVSLGSWDGRPDDPAALPMRGDYATRIEASEPIVTQQTRRARWRDRPEVVGARSMMGWPVRGAGHDLWYYPGGELRPRGVTPDEATWNLLFTYNPAADPGAMVLEFHTPAGRVSESPALRLPPQRSDLQWLHQRPWLGRYTRAGAPFAVTVRARQPVVPSVTCAEYEPESRGCPGAMSAVPLYPGPLANERTWWLGVGQTGLDPISGARWEQTYSLFNPSAERVHVRLSVVDARGGMRRLEPITVGPQALATVDSSQFAGLPEGTPIAVRADGDRPFVAQATVRAFRGDDPVTRSMYANMGRPMPLDAWSSPRP